MPGQSAKGAGQQVRRGHRSQRPAHVLQNKRVDLVQGEGPTHLSPVRVQAIRDRLHLFPAEPVLRIERGHVLRGRCDTG